MGSMGPSAVTEAEVAKMQTDWQGLSVNTLSASCLAHMESYSLQVLSYGASARIILKAAEADPQCVLANALAASYLLACQRGKRQEQAQPYLAAAAHYLEQGSEYEQLVARAIAAWAEASWDAAIALHRQLAREYPADLVSVKRGQTLGFYLGRQDLMLELAQEVLPHSKDRPYMSGLLAFALLENGCGEEAELAAREGLRRCPSDVWSQHALCHVLQDRCRFTEALRLADEWVPSWQSRGSFFYTHIWWHTALCHLERSHRGSLAVVLALYDERIWNQESGDRSSPLVQLNALGLLLKLELRSHHACVEARLGEVVLRLQDPSSWHQDTLLDLLSLWALARLDSSCSVASKLLESMSSWLASLPPDRQRDLRPSLLPVARALVAFGKRDYEGVCRALPKDFSVASLKPVGASDEQLEVVEELRCVALLRAGRAAEATPLLEDRVARRPGVPHTWRLLEEAYLGLRSKSSEKAALAHRQAEALEAS